MNTRNLEQYAAVGTACLALFFTLVNANPPLSLGSWVNISPPGIAFSATANQRYFTQGMAVDPENPSTLYLCVCGSDATTFQNLAGGGIFRTTDGGSTWTTIGSFDTPINVRVDPNNPKHLYACCGVRGGTMGFWVTTDGGNSWAIPDGFKSAVADSRVGNVYDMYHIAVDPVDFNHVLVSFHSPWANTGSCGVLESNDAGISWTVRMPNSGMTGPGFDVFFLYDPASGIGNRSTWLVGCQGSGYWRTSDAGVDWSQVSSAAMAHGGAQIYYTKTGVLYASTATQVIRSNDNGVSWSAVGTVQWENAVYGDGTNLYTAFGNGGNFVTSPETNGTTWTNFNSQTFVQGPFEMTFDSANSILYAACWGAGLWALKVNKPYAGITLSNAHASPSSVMDNATAVVTFSVDAVAQGSLTGVTIDLSPLGGNSSTPMTNTSGNTYTAVLTVPTGSAPGAKSLLLTAADNTNHSLFGSITFTVVDHAAPVLVSLNKPVVVSSCQDSTVAGKFAVDGDQSTRWSTGSTDPQWIYVDLGSVMVVNRVILMWETAYGKSYQIQVSTDAGSWTDVFSTTTGDGGTDSITFASTNARYLRMYGTQRGTTYGYSLYEFDVYAPASGTTGASAAQAKSALSEPMLSVSRNKIVVAVPGTTTPWTLDLFTLSGCKLVSVEGHGSKDVPVLLKADVRGYLAARLNLGTTRTIRSMICRQ